MEHRKQCWTIWTTKQWGNLHYWSFIIVKHDTGGMAAKRITAGAIWYIKIRPKEDIKMNKIVKKP